MRGLMDIKKAEILDSIEDRYLIVPPVQNQEPDYFQMMQKQNEMDQAAKLKNRRIISLGLPRNINIQSPLHLKYKDQQSMGLQTSESLENLNMASSVEDEISMRQTFMNTVKTIPLNNPMINGQAN